MDKSRVCHAHESLSYTLVCALCIPLPQSLRLSCLLTIWYTLKNIFKTLVFSKIINTFEQSVIKFVLQSLYSKSLQRWDLVSKQRHCIKCLTTFLWSSLFPQLTFKFCDWLGFCWVESTDIFLKRKSRKY